MSKSKKSRPFRKLDDAGDDKKNASRAKHRGKPGHAARETVESIVVAVILAFLFRGFLAEAFVIPTGSMAPTLQGRHKDVECDRCHHWYRVGASGENGFRNRPQELVISTTCPICRHTISLDLDAKKHWSFSGDRILVSKFAYDLSAPERWDVIVFKYPGNAVQNYIKRLVGLPNETLRIYRGDIYIKPDAPEGDSKFEIARKPDDKLLTMLQLVDDTKYIPPQLKAAGWQRWKPWAAGGDASPYWQWDEQGWGVRCNGDSQQDVMLRYHHIVPDALDWECLDRQKSLDPPVTQRQGQLITDFYAYNAGVSVSERTVKDYPTPLLREEIAQIDASRYGQHWVGDLALEADLKVEGSQGDLVLDLVEGGIHYECRIDVSTGQAQLLILGGGDFTRAASNEGTAAPTAQTTIQGPGSYHVRFSNVDDELRLWVDNQRILFDRPTTYPSPVELRPTWSPQDPGDLAPAGVGSQGLAIRIDRLKVFRDIYYIAVGGDSSRANDYSANKTPQQLHELFQSPQRWEDSRVFDQYHHEDFSLKADQFFPMGDNSPQSSDARIWTRLDSDDPSPEHFVERKLLIGKAVLIYWPHHWYEPIPFWPNFGRMGLIR